MIRRKRNKGNPNNKQEKELLNYISGKMSTKDQQEFETELEKNAFLNDAAEGLQTLDGEKIPDILAELNAGLRKQLKQKRQRKTLFSNQKLMIWVSVIVILLFIFVVWWYISIILAK